MRHGYDEDQVATHGIPKCVGELLEHTAPNVTYLQRVHQRHMADALRGGAHLLRE